MYKLPSLNDTQVLAIIGTHPEEFFEAMKEFEPYILIRASATRLEIKLRSSYVDLEKLEATFERLDSLGYHPEAHTVTYTKSNGEQVIDLDNITIEWKKCDKPSIEFVSYTGAYPNLCSGILTMKVNGKQYEFGHDWLNSLLGKGGDPPDRLPRFWRSGGSCGFDDDWNEEVGQGPWVMSDEIKEDKYPKEIWDCLEDILEVMNQNVPGGCCGGCL